ncbi:MAG: DUF177 domain-containing protein [Flavobacteriales bacterium]|nr:DUF177 domain-containing protein [Flavobacteriales bacterium]
MKLKNEYLIPFAGLKIGKHQFTFEIKKAFFESFECEEFNDVSIQLAVELDKKSTLLEFDFEYEGHVNVACDLTTETFDLPVEGHNKLIVKFGNEYSDEDVELIIIPHGDHEIDISQFIYENILLSIPTKRVHPGVEDGTLESDILDKLEELSPKEIKATEDEANPMWDKLKKLIKDK